MAELFQTTKQNISLHIKNIYEDKDVVIKDVLKPGMVCTYDYDFGVGVQNMNGNFGTDANTTLDQVIAGRRSIRKFKDDVPPKESIEPYLRKNAKSFVNIVENAALNGLPAFKTAPYFIVVGDHKGFPPVEKESLAYALENMWLKSTALGLGFQLVSAVQSMAKNKAFMELIGIPYGEFELDACVIGYPDQVPPERTEVPVSRLTKWL